MFDEGVGPTGNRFVTRGCFREADRDWMFAEAEAVRARVTLTEVSQDRWVDEAARAMGMDVSGRVLAFVFGDGSYRIAADEPSAHLLSEAAEAIWKRQLDLFVGESLPSPDGWQRMSVRWRDSEDHARRALLTSGGFWACSDAMRVVGSEFPAERGLAVTNEWGFIASTEATVILDRALNGVDPWHVLAYSSVSCSGEFFERCTGWPDAPYVSVEHQLDGCAGVVPTEADTETAIKVFLDASTGWSDLCSPPE
ncbi:MAG: hypothetical protein HY905_08390 [Deltaproteobacteria bacterium]|nr:hypothetical protein [Deltaproteobacteria bacterium]